MVKRTRTVWAPGGRSSGYGKSGSLTEVLNGQEANRPVFGSLHLTAYSTSSLLVLTVAGVADIGFEGTFDVRESFVRTLPLGL